MSICKHKDTSMLFTKLFNLQKWVHFPRLKFPGFKIQGSSQLYHFITSLLPSKSLSFPKSEFLRLFSKADVDMVLALSSLQNFFLASPLYYWINLRVQNQGYAFRRFSPRTLWYRQKFEKCHLCWRPCQSINSKPNTTEICITSNGLGH